MPAKYNLARGGLSGLDQEMDHMERSRALPSPALRPEPRPPEHSSWEPRPPGAGFLCFIGNCESLPGEQETKGETNRGRQGL